MGGDGRHILIVDDDADIREMIGLELKKDGHVVDGVGSAAALDVALRDRSPDLVILDLSLPDGDGLDIARRLRRDGCPFAIMMVTARGAPLDRIAGLELGADDYLAKPFEPRELRARVRNLLRRAPPAAASTTRARLAHFGPWRLDMLRRRLVAPDERLVILSAAEFRLLHRFLLAPRCVLSREELLPERKATVAFDRSIDLQISRLRHKLASVEGGSELILTVRSEGYVLGSEVVFA